MRRLGRALCAAACLAATAGAQVDPADVSLVGVSRRSVGLAATPFRIWAGFADGTLASLPRLGPGEVEWYGPDHGLPSEGLASICWDDPSRTLWLRSRTGRLLRWSEPFSEARESDGDGTCNTTGSRAMAVQDLPALWPEIPGWRQEGLALRGPGNLEEAVRQALVVDGHELWLATTSGIWTGSASSGRVHPVALGLPEACVRALARDARGGLWSLGCNGSLARRDPSGLLETDPLPLPTTRPSLEGFAPRRRGGIWAWSREEVFAWGRPGQAVTRSARPFGGNLRACVEQGDTLWCATERAVSRLPPGQNAFEILSPPGALGGGAEALAATPEGLLAGTREGFWILRDTLWIRPDWVSPPPGQPVLDLAMEPDPGRRLAWHDGQELRVDTLPGAKGPPGRWRPGFQRLYGMAWDHHGNLHLATGDWTLWNPTLDLHVGWHDGLGLPGRILAVLPDDDLSVVGGEGGYARVRDASYLPAEAIER